jgi:hypothetical protein
VHAITTAGLTKHYGPRVRALDSLDIAVGEGGLAASASFDRLPPALGVTIGFVVVMYFLDVLGSLWPAAGTLQPYSLFHYLKPKAILVGAGSPLDQAVLAAVVVAAMGWALVVFPRRDLAAPS